MIVLYKRLGNGEAQLKKTVCETPLIEAFHKPTAVIFEHFRFDQHHAWQGRLDEIHQADFSDNSL